MTTHDTVKQELDKLTTCPDISDYLVNFMDEEVDDYAHLFVQRAYQLGLETGLEANAEFSMVLPQVKKVVQIADRIMDKCRRERWSEERYYAEILNELNSQLCKKCTHFKWDYNYLNRDGVYNTIGYCTKHQRYCKFVKNCQDKEDTK